MIVIYHESCYDGFTAAWLIWRNLSEEGRELTTFIADQYGKPFSLTYKDIKDQDIVIADFSYTRLQLELIADLAKSLIVLDHHKTAKQALEGLPFCKFDMSKSGARLVQEHFNYPNHWLVDYTEDRDLWLHKLPNTKEINAAIRLTPFDFEEFENLASEYPEDLAMTGRNLLLYEQNLIDTHVRHAEEVIFDGHKVLKVNTTTLHSEIGNRLCQGRPFSITYFCNEKEVTYSLRSTDEGLDVSEIAKKYGGGGHRNAAGFKVINEEFQETL